MKSFIYPLFINITLMASFLTLFLFIGFVFYKKYLVNFFKKNGLVFILLISLLATIGSLSFSEILKWVPCKLCWYQRIFIYPQVFIATIGYFLKDKKVYFYHFWLSLFGFIIALFHYLIQKNIIVGVDCNLVSSTTSCLKINFAYGFISIPFMAMISFLLIIIISFINFYETKKTKD